MSEKVEQALAIALKNLIGKLTKSDELNRFSVSLQKRKQYDACERQYIENQRLRKQLGNEYESSDSQQQKDKISNLQMKKMIRKNLVGKHFDEDTLESIKDQQENEQQIDEFTTVRFIAEQTMQINERKSELLELNTIQQAKEIVQQEVQRPTNFGLQFLILELQKIQKGNLLTAK